MAKRTELLCIHEGKQGSSIDPVFINRLIKSLKPAWIRPFGSNSVRLEACGSRKELIARMPEHLRACINAGGNVTLMVWADVDDDMQDPDALLKCFWDEAKNAGIAKAEFDQVVFSFAKDRIENWIEFLTIGSTDESQEGPRVHHNKVVREAALTLAGRCRGERGPDLPPSLAWSCRNWRALVDRMQA